MWKIWSIGSLGEVKVVGSSVFTVVGGASSLRVGGRCPLARFLELSGWRLSGSSCEMVTLKHILFSLKCKKVIAIGCWLTSGEESTWVSLVPSSMTRCCASRIIFIFMSSWWLTCVTASRSRSAVSRWMAINSRSRSAFVGARPVVIIGRSLSGRVVRGRGMMDQIRQEHWRRVGWGSCKPWLLYEGIFVEGLGYWWRDLKSMVSSLSTKASNVMGEFLRNQFMHQNNGVGIIKSQKVITNTQNLTWKIWREKITLRKRRILL